MLPPQVFVVWAKCKWDNKIRGFVLEKGAKGLTAPQIKNKLSLRASITGSIYMDNVSVPADHVLDVEGLKGPFTCLKSVASFNPLYLMYLTRSVCTATLDSVSRLAPSVPLSRPSRSHETTRFRG